MTYLESKQTNRSKIFNRVLAFILKRTIVSDIVQGIIFGCVLAFITVALFNKYEFKAIQTTINGWSTTMECGEPGNGILVRDACASVLPAVNLPQEEVYWTTTVDSTGQTLNGQHNYILHFPPGGLPPNDASWSLTMTDAQQHLVDNPANRYNVGAKSGLVQNADESIDISIQNTAPFGHESNWLPAPSGGFKLWLRVYLPGATILNGTYQVPPVTLTQ